MPSLLSPRRSASGIRSGMGALAERVATPLLPSDYVDLLSPLASSAELRGKVVGVLPETVDSATLIIKPGRTWKGHRPGQYIRVGVDINGVRRWRAYSLTSSPERPDGNLTITVKTIEEGLVSNHLVHRIRTGTVIQLDQATGDFTLGEQRRRKQLFVTAGSGITPVMGMLRGHSEDLEGSVLIHSAPTGRDVIFGRELRGIADEGRIELIEIHTDRAGMLNPANLAAMVPDLAEREIRACGPTGMLDSIEAHLETIGLAHRLRTERFRPAVVVTGEGGTIHFTVSDVNAQGDGATPILDVGEEAGVLMPSGCRMGICFGCVSRLREGAVRDLRTGEVTTATTGDEIQIQTCVSAAAGTCQIEL
ncbi:MAG: ferredoxin reductase [Solirubrobacterales bacterium]|nr:ferredoxin reductase [Solirubrobacterales bacterium]MCB8915062.1 ferredoxin reductase [Thermoleophilales bacterium]